MNSHNVIHSELVNNKFLIPIQFRLFGRTHKISNAVFDTGCTHSLIPVRLLQLNDNEVNKLKRLVIYNKNIKAILVSGVESHGINMYKLDKLICDINYIKDACNSNDVSADLIDKYITKDGINTLLNSVNVRYEICTKNFAISKTRLGNVNVTLSFTASDLCLVGMHIIKQLRTEIYSKNGETILIATKNSDKAKALIENYKLHVDDLLDDIQVVESNYVNKVSKKEQ